jgi:signal transduction histidine kinase
MIHDELGQSLTALKIDLSWMRENRKSENAVHKLEMMLANTNDIIRKVQRISSELHPKLLTELGLADAIEWYCGQQHDRTGLLFELSLEENVSKDFIKDLALYRILQEAVTNVIRHARASKVVISIRYEKEGIYMIITDDGIGINPEILESSNSMGLFGMRERAEQCYGNLELSLNKPSGTKVTVFIPTSKNDKNEDINS